MLYTRRYLLASLGCASGVSAALGPGSLLAASAVPCDAIARLRGLVDDQASARQLGRSYRALFPVESDPAELARLILGSLACTGNPQTLKRDELLTALDQRVRAEFGAGHTLPVEGWILSLTEARLCALCE